MSNITTKYIVYNHDGGGIRHHHLGIQNNIIDEAHGTTSPGEHISALGFPHLEFNGQLVPFAFMSVIGNADDNHLYTEPGNRDVIAGASDITILAVYAPAGGIGSPNGPGVWVDAFNVNMGQFSDSPTFMQVLTPPTPPDSININNTNEANIEGDISTASAENMRADNIVDGIPFLKWKKIVPSEMIVNTRDVSLTQNETGEIWFAFYQSPQITIPRTKRELYEQWIYVSEGVLVGGGGFVVDAHGIIHPVPPPTPWGTLPAKLLSTLAILSISSNMSKEVKAEAINLAVNHLYSLAEFIKTMEIK